MSFAVVASLAAWPLASLAVTQDNFLVRTTADLVELCSAGEGDPLRVAAIHFCEGYVAGASQYHQAEWAGSGATPLFCLPNPPPTRDDAIRMFIAWARKSPQYMSERPVDSLIRFAAMTWPCKR